MTGKLDYLDDNERVIASPLWRSVCGNPSNNSWQKYRKSVGIPAENKKHKLTRREAYLLLVRSRLRVICDRLGVDKPRDSEIAEYLPTSPLFAIASSYAETLPIDGLSAILADAINASNLSGDAILALLATVGEVAKSNLGERQIKLIISSAGLGTILKKRIYSYTEVQRFINAISTALPNSQGKPTKNR